MGASAPSSAMRTRGLIAAIAAVTIAGLNYGFIAPLIAVLMERREIADPDGAVTGRVEPKADGLGWKDAIGRALAELPADQREAFLLRHVEDVSYEDMSALTGAGISALKMRVKRACDSLRDRLRSETDDH